MPRYPLGSFGATPLASFGKTASQTQLASFGDGPCRRGIDTFRDSTHQNWYWLRFGKPIRGRSCPFSRPIMPRYPLGSFGAGEGDRLESSHRIDKERGQEGEPSSTNTIEEGAEPFQEFVRLWQLSVHQLARMGLVLGPPSTRWNGPRPCGQGRRCRPLW